MEQQNLFDTYCPDCDQPYVLGGWPFPCGGHGHALGSFWRGDSQIHTSEKVVVHRNIFTGDVRIPGRGDRPVHPKLAAEGYVRETLNTPADIRRVEKQNNIIHERSQYDANSAAADRDTGSN